MIRILVAEDSPTARALIVGMLQSDPELSVVAEAASGLEAVEMAARVRPDLITMDVQMPGMDGLAATEQIMARAPTPIIIVSALADERQASLSLDAMRVGALIVLPKPVGPGSPGFAAQRSQLVAMVKAMAAVKVVRRWGENSSVARLAMRQGTSAEGISIEDGIRREAYRGPRPRLVAIAASTGGPAALREILTALPADFPVPIAIVQHIAKGFVGALSHWLGGAGPLAVTVVADRERLRPGTVYLAPDDAHFGVIATRENIVARLSQESAIGSFRPSATWLFESAAAALGDALSAVILTGMGDDGVRGLRAVKQAGGKVIAQDEATSVIYGMPREAARAGVVDVVASLADIAAHLVEVVA